jgi:hypothetical protein
MTSVQCEKLHCSDSHGPPNGYSEVTQTGLVALSQVYAPETAYSVSVSDGPTGFGGPVWCCGTASQYLTAQNLIS